MMGIKELYAMIRALVMNRRKDKVALMMRCMGHLDRLMDFGYLDIEVEKPRVIISAGLHLSYANREKEYRALFEKIIGWINFRRAQAEPKLPMLKVEDRIEFLVTGMAQPFVLVGVFQDGRLWYRSVDGLMKNKDGQLEQ